jgi:hypothetical protein
VIGHSDFDTLVFAGADLALTRRLVHTYCDQQQPGWMDAVDGRIGRRLPALVGRSPLQVRQVHAQVAPRAGLCPLGAWVHAGQGGGCRGRQVRPVHHGGAECWLAGLRTASARGDYLFSINDYIVVATKEPQEATHAAS